MLKNKRKARRQPMHYSAWVAPAPHQLHGCVLADVSEFGARINVEDEAALPDLFFLLFSRSGKTRRVCQVVWRKPRQIGVKFMRSYRNAEAAELPRIVAEAKPARSGT